MMKMTKYVKFSQILLKIKFGQKDDGSIVALSFNSIFKGVVDSRLLPMNPDKMEKWIIQWTATNQGALLQQLGRLYAKPN